MNRDSFVGILSGLAATAIWGGMYVVSKAVMAVIPPFSLIVLRLTLGMAVLFGVIVYKKRSPKSPTSAETSRQPNLPKKLRRQVPFGDDKSPDSTNRNFLGIAPRQFWGIFAVGLVGYGISLGFQFVGTDLSTAANGSLVTSATPAFVLLFAALILKEKITPRRLLALVVATLGVLAVIDPRTAQLSSQLFWGNLSLVAAALTWALYSVLVRKVTRDVDVLTTSLVAFAGGLPVCLPLGAWEAARQGYGPITWGVAAGVLFLGIVSTALAMVLWNTAFARLEAGVAALTFFAQPVVGTVLGALFLGDEITPLFLVGGVLIGIGLIISR
jgi:drug/metabolite transporter (DMT)-like permease